MEGTPLGFTVGDFWRWGVSDLLVNTTRGVVAEYLVSRALGCAEPVRDSWGAFDLRTATGIRVEVKCAAYRQAWMSHRLSRVVFEIAPKLEWDSETDRMIGPPKRHAEVYVFCLLDNREWRDADPLIVDRWKFLVLPASILPAHQKTIGLAALKRLGARECDFRGLAGIVEECGGERRCS